jgi:uncharacterized membrane protein YbhN (UPF0104 family)
MTTLQATDRAVAEFALGELDLRRLLRRLALPAGLAAAVVLVLLARGHAHAFIDGIQRGLRVSPAWAMLGVVLEGASLAAYVALLALVAGRATGRIGWRESAQITFAGAAATRLLPTAGAGGIGLAVWALRRAGMNARCATRTLVTFLVVLYAAFLTALGIAGGVLALGLVRSDGPEQLSVLAASVSLGALALCIALALRTDDMSRARARGGRARRVSDAAMFLGETVRDAWKLVRSGDWRVAGAVAYWGFDAAVLWAMLHALGTPPALPVVVLAYFAGQVANTLPLPGSVSGGITGVLIAFAVPAELALPAVLAYRAVSVWLPTPMAIASVPALRATVTRWGSGDEAGARRDGVAVAQAG